MEHARFDALVQQWGQAGTRRRLLGVLGGLGLGSVLLPAPGETKKKKAKRFCLNGQNVKAKNKKKTRKLRKRGAVRGRCQACTPNCTSGACRCGAGSVCAGGACQPCTVTCSGTASECGTALQSALAGGGNLYVCPGRYAAAGFTIDQAGTSVYGAGSSNDPASGTILDAQGANASVILIPPLPPGSPVTLSGLRITGGNGIGAPGGIGNLNASLIVESCAIVENVGSDFAGAILTSGPLTLANSLVSGNTCVSDGPGGIRLAGEVNRITSSVIDGNTGDRYGGIRADLQSGAILTVDSTSQITNNTANGVVVAGGIAREGDGSADATGTTVTGNTDPQCVGVIGCS